jgi:hypothetical protein
VAILYPKLRRRFGNNVTYGQKPSAHIQTEFGFDVLQIAQGHYAPQAYHDFIGFEVAKPLLERAFKETYGIELSSLFTNLDLAIGTYRHSVSTVIPKMTRVAWESTKSDLAKRGLAKDSTLARDSARTDSAKRPSSVTRDQFIFNLSRSAYAKEWGNQYQKPGFFARVLSVVFRIVPKIGPFKGFAIKPSTPETELLFMKGFDSTTVLYRRSLVRLGANTLTLDDRDLDTGTPTKAGEYQLADDAYARMLHILAGNKFKNVTPALRSNIISFYRDTTMRKGTKKDSVAWKRTLGDLTGLRNAGTAPPSTGQR